MARRVYNEMERRDDLDLVQFLRVVWKRRWVVVTGLLVCTSAGALPWYLMSPMYEARVLLRVGRVWKEPIENIHSVIAVINSESFLARVRDEAGIDRPLGELRKDVAVRASVAGESGARSETGGALIRIMTRAKAPEECVRLATTASSITVAKHAPAFETLVRQNADYEKMLREQVGGIEREVGRLEELILAQSGKTEVEGTAVILLQAQLLQKHQQLLDARRELRDVELKNNADSRTHSTEVIAKPILPEWPVSTGLALWLLIGFVGGSVPVLGLVFLLELIERDRARTGQPAA